MKQRLLKVIDRELDGLRIYRLRGKRGGGGGVWARQLRRLTEPLVL